MRLRVVFTKVFVGGLLEGATYEETRGVPFPNRAAAERWAREVDGVTVLYPIGGGNPYRFTDVRIVPDSGCG
jgi:hypothetical protein